MKNAKSKKRIFKKVDYEPNKMTLAVAALAGVTLVLAVIMVQQ